MSEKNTPAPPEERCAYVYPDGTGCGQPRAKWHDGSIGSNAHAFVAPAPLAERCACGERAGSTGKCDRCLLDSMRGKINPKPPAPAPSEKCDRLTLCTDYRGHHGECAGFAPLEERCAKCGGTGRIVNPDPNGEDIWCDGCHRLAPAPLADGDTWCAECGETVPAGDAHQHTDAERAPLADGGEILPICDHMNEGGCKKCNAVYEEWTALRAENYTIAKNANRLNEEANALRAENAELRRQLENLARRS